MKSERYKDIYYSYDKKYDLLEFNTLYNDIRSPEDFINKLNHFTELAESIRPGYVLFNKKGNYHEIHKNLIGFARHQVIETLLKQGVKEVFFLIPEKQYHQKCHKVHTTPFKTFMNMADITGFINMRNEQ